MIWSFNHNSNKQFYQSKNEHESGKSKLHTHCPITWSRTHHVLIAEWEALCLHISYLTPDYSATTQGPFTPPFTSVMYLSVMYLNPVFINVAFYCFLWCTFIQSELMYLHPIFYDVPYSSMSCCTFLPFAMMYPSPVSHVVLFSSKITDVPFSHFICCTLVCSA